METKNNKPLIIVFVVLSALFLFFLGGALSVTINDGGVMGSGWSSGISWMWLLALLFLSLGIMVGWPIFSKNKA